MIYRQIVEFKSETLKERKGKGSSDNGGNGNFCSAHKYLFIKLLSLPAKYPDPSRQTVLRALPVLQGLYWLCFASGFCHHSMGLCSRPLALPSSPLHSPSVALPLLIARHSLIFKSDFINWMPFLCKYLISRQRAQDNGNFYPPLFSLQIPFLLVPCFVALSFSLFLSWSWAQFSLIVASVHAALYGFGIILKAEIDFPFLLCTTFRVALVISFFHSFSRQLLVLLSFTGFTYR